MSFGQPPTPTGGSPQPIYLEAREPSERDRVTVLIRIIMAIPQIVVLFFVGIGAFVIAVIGWFAALFTGRLPDFAEEYLSGYVRWTARFNGYLYLLTDEYPPFTFEPVEQYPVAIAIPPPEPLNPLAVLLRFFIAIPGFIVATVAGYGLGVLSIVSWVIIVFTGRMPRPLFEAGTAVIRYEARMLGYWLMLTPEYAWGLYGDGAAGDRASEAVGQAPRGWTLILSSEGRTALTTMVVVGAILFVIYNLRTGF